MACRRTIEEKRSRLTFAIIFHCIKSALLVNNLFMHNVDESFAKRKFRTFYAIATWQAELRAVLNIKFEFKEAEKLFVKIGAKIPYLPRRRRRAGRALLLLKKVINDRA